MAMSRRELTEARNRIKAICNNSGTKSSLYNYLRMPEARFLLQGEGKGANMWLQQYGGDAVKAVLSYRFAGDWPALLKEECSERFDGEASDLRRHYRLKMVGGDPTFFERLVSSFGGEPLDMPEAEPQPAPVPPPPPPPNQELLKQSPDNPFARAKEMIEQAVANGTIKNPHKQLEEMLTCVLMFGRCYAAGPSGTGKSFAAKQVAAILGREDIYHGCNKNDYPEKYLGNPTLDGTFKEGVVTGAYDKPVVLVLDEMDKADSGCTACLNQFVNFDDNVNVGDRKVHRHEDFVFIGTGNSAMDGPGGSEGVYDTERQSADFVARWEQLGVMVHFDYDPDMERVLLGMFASEYDLLAKARKNIKDEGVSSARTIQTRTCLGWEKWRSAGLTIGETVGRMCRLWSPTEIKKVWKHLSKTDLDMAVSMVGSW